MISECSSSAVNLVSSAIEAVGYSMGTISEVIWDSSMDFAS